MAQTRRVAGDQTPGHYATKFAAIVPRATDDLDRPQVAGWSDHCEFNPRLPGRSLIRLLAMAFVQFSGVTYHDPDLAYSSYVLYTGADGVSRLIDLNGVVRNEWPHPGVPARIIDPVLNGGRLGDIGVQLSQLEDSPGGIYGNRTVGQLSWSGETVWEWGTEAPGGAARQNHDWELLENGNRLILVAIPREVPGLGPHIVGDQGIYEVTPDGRIVWDWKAGDHSGNSASPQRDSNTCAEVSCASRQPLGLPGDQQRQNTRTEPLASR
jgi:hypothetical protein